MLCESHTVSLTECEQRHINVKSLCCMPETNTTSYTHSTLTLKKKKSKNKNILYPAAWNLAVRPGAPATVLDHESVASI